MDFKRWIETTTGLPAQETGYRKTTQLPYVIIQDDIERRGADKWICLTEHTTTFYYCTEIRNPETERRIETALEQEQWEYRKEVEYERNDKLFIITYYFNFLEKE